MPRNRLASRALASSAVLAMVLTGAASPSASVAATGKSAPVLRVKAPEYAKPRSYVLLKIRVNVPDGGPATGKVSAMDSFDDVGPDKRLRNGKAFYRVYVTKGENEFTAFFHGNRTLRPSSKTIVIHGDGSKVADRRVVTSPR